MRLILHLSVTRISREIKKNLSSQVFQVIEIRVIATRLYMYNNILYLKTSNLYYNKLKQFVFENIHRI